MRRLLSFTLVRLIVLLILTGSVWIGTMLAIRFVAQDQPAEVQIAAVTIGFLVSAGAVILAYRFGVRLIEHRRGAELGGAESFPSFAAGAGIGLVLIATVYVVLWALGVARIEGLGSVTRILPILALSIGAACAEEVVFRGVIFRIVEEGFGTLAALVLSAAIFGGLHSWNPGASLLSSLAIALEAGVLLGLAYAGGRTLWLPIGIHFGWNFAEGGVFSGAVSGLHLQGLLDVKLVGPDLLTGGAFGPEASVVTLVVCLTASAALAAATVRHGGWRPMRLALAHPGGDG